MSMGRGNGSGLHSTHPNLMLLFTTIAIGCIGLGINFLVLSPTFLIWHTPNWVWGAAYLTVGAGQLLALFWRRNTNAVKRCTLLLIGYFAFLGAGACEPFLDGSGSLQLPLFYLMMAVVQVPVFMEPFVNPATARNGNGNGGNGGKA